MRVNSLVFRIGVVYMGVYGCGFPVIMIYMRLLYGVVVLLYECLFIPIFIFGKIFC